MQVWYLGRHLVLFGVLAVAPASAQPFVFPLQKQPQEQAAPPPIFAAGGAATGWPVAAALDGLRGTPD